MFLSIKPLGLTSAGRFLDQFSVACALDHSAVGAGSTQQGVHSHSNIFHQIKLGTVCPASRPYNLPIQKHSHVIQITAYSLHLDAFTAPTNSRDARDGQKPGISMRASLLFLENRRCASLYARVQR